MNMNRKREKDKEIHGDKEGNKNLNIPKNAAVRRCGHPYALGLLPANHLSAGWRALTTGST